LLTLVGDFAASIIGPLANHRQHCLH
jgi:hypothetical protein